VKANSVVKLLVGKDLDVDSDATVSFVEYGSKEGLIVSQAVKPHYSDIDTYHMVASVIDESLRRIIAVGGKMPSKDHIVYALDNFCWNLSSTESPDGQYKMAQLVRANQALSDYCGAFGVPCISGKDSMKNVWKLPDGTTVSIPPTLLFSARAKIDDVGKAVTMDAKNAGDLVYVIGKTFDELGGSEYLSYMGEKLGQERYVGNNVPKVDAEGAKKTYNALSEATDKGLVNSAHTPTTGGLGVALAKSAFAGGFGMDIDLRKVPYSGEKREDFLLFSQSNSRFVVTISPEKKEEFEATMNGTVYSQVGVVTDNNKLRFRGFDGKEMVNLRSDKAKSAWKSTLEAL
jgi:phosphoribosylformylglycinamidine synthase